MAGMAVNQNTLLLTIAIALLVVTNIDEVFGGLGGLDFHKGQGCNAFATCTYTNMKWYEGSKLSTKCYNTNEKWNYYWTYKASCNHGYTMPNNVYEKIMKCQAKTNPRSYVWNQAPPSNCTVMDNYCPAPPAIQNGRIVNQSPNRRIGESFRVLCDADHTAHGDGVNTGFTVPCIAGTYSAGKWAQHPDCALPCPEGYNHDSVLHRCIAVISLTATGDNARKACQNLDGSLVRVRSAAETAHIYDLVDKQATWIGLRNDGNLGWAWSIQSHVYTQLYGYTNWQQDYPKQGAGYCTATRSDNALWYNVNCNSGSPGVTKFVCETAACWYTDYTWDAQLGRCVKLYKEKVSRQEAEHQCNDHQATLIQVFTYDESERLRELIGVTDEGLWLGLTRTAGNWTWQGVPRKSANMPLSSQYFRPWGTANPSGDCAYMNFKQWDSTSCGGDGESHKFWYMCQTLDCPHGYTYSSTAGRCLDQSYYSLEAFPGKICTTPTSGTQVCIRYEALQTDWYTAQRTCALDNARLLDFENHEDKDSLLKHFNVQNTAVWFGLNDIRQEKSWVYPAGVPTDQKKPQPLAEAGYKNWGRSEPNGGTRENCVVTGNEGWKDMPCQYRFGFVCEGSIYDHSPKRIPDGLSLYP